MLRGAHQMLQEGARRWISNDLHRFLSILETPRPESRAGLWRHVAAGCGPLNKIVLQIWCARKLADAERRLDWQTGSQEAIRC